jgi:transaldolase
MINSDKKVIDFLQKDLNEKPVTGKRDSFWESLRRTGTELWLDTGDIEEALTNWSAEMSALTTNNTLLNNEIQKGIYDNFIAEAKTIVKGLPPDEKIKEIAFMLNARHGLRLAAKFGGLVSVELHTDTANDLKAIDYYGKRFHKICPNQFIVKVPYTATGLLGARLLKNSGIKINFTLEFSARENVIVTAIARPDYLNVFLGRIGAYIINNNLGDGSGAGEMAVLSSQKWVTKLSARNPWPTKLIAASLRNFEQLELLAGTDVYTMPPKVAAAGRASLSGKFTSRINEIYNAGMNESGKMAHLEKFWSVDDKVLKLADSFILKAPHSAEELIIRTHEAGCGDLFPFLSNDDYYCLATDGKIPLHSIWEKRIAENTLAPDILLTLAGLASFTSDQKMLDERIKSIIG